MENNNYISNVTAYCMLIVHIRFSFLFKTIFLFLILFAVTEHIVIAADNYIGEEEVAPFVYDEIPVHLIVEGYNNFYVDAIYTKNNILFVNIEDLFKTINIPCVVGQKGNNLSGFIVDESQTYLIDYDAKQIKIGAKTINSQNRLVKEIGTLYMESSLFAEAFGIVLNFNYRTLSITLKSNFELPVIKQLRIEKMRNNMSKVKGEVIADTVLQRNYHLFKLGTLDWLAASSQTWNRSTGNHNGTEGLPEVSSQAWKELTDNHFSLGVGTELLYGEADIAVNYYDRQKFDNRQLQYLWRWVDNDKSIIKQAQLGKISTQTISFINSPIIGAVIRNSPTTVRKATGYYTINEFTEPNWIVELYLNDVMVDYTKADASGLYIFKVPIVYGYITLKLKFYGPLGEERTEERTMNVPFTVMPAKEFEYGLSAGIVQDSSSSRFGKSEFNYGVNRILTVGGGLEYLSSIPNAPFIPFAKATMQPFSKLTLNGEYAYGVKTRGLLDYYFKKDVLLEIDYAKYVEGQLATRFNALIEKKVKLSVPFRYKKINGYAKLDYTQLVYKAFNYNLSNLMFSAYYKHISANASTQLNWIGQKPVYVTTDLALSYRLKKGYNIRPSAQYDASKNVFMTYKVAVEKNIPRGNISVSYERNVLYNDNFISLNFRYDLSFARTNISASHSNGKVNISESAQGSLAFGSGNKYVNVSNNSSVSKGGISLYPFLDLNHNGIFDQGEHMVKLTSVKIMGGKVIFSEKDSIIRIADLNAFTNYMVEFNDFDLENIAWRFKNKRYQVLIDPNQYKHIDIPIIPFGEISGMAYRNDDNTMKGIGRILVKIYNKNNMKVVAETLSESDGYIYYLGLEPGEYIARIDSVQLSNLGFTEDPPQKDFTIKTLADGDIIGGLDFVLRSEQNDSLNKQNIISDVKIEVTAGDEKKSPPTNTAVPIEQKYATPQDIQKNKQPESKLHIIGKKVSIVKDMIVHVTGNTFKRITKADNKIMDTMVHVPADILYKVQLLALRSPLKVKDYFTQLLADVPGLTIIETLGEDGLYHYSTGAFRDKVEARKFLRIIRKSGWKDCFVAIYAGGIRAEMAFRPTHGNSVSQFDTKVPAKQILPGGQKIEIQETEKRVPKQQQNILPLDRKTIAKHDPVMHLAERISVMRDTLDYIPGDTLYNVHLLTLRDPIRVKGYFVRLLTDVPGLTILEMEGKDGLFQYSTGAFRGLVEAMEFLQYIKQSGWTDCFIASYTAGKRDEPVFRLKRGKSGSQFNKKVAGYPVISGY